MNQRRIPESEFMEDLDQALADISAAIRSSGLSISAIARGTRCHFESVSHAANGIPVRFDTYRRIMYFLNNHAG